VLKLIIKNKRKEGQGLKKGNVVGVGQQQCPSKE
jgi:hypothetical protein